VLKRYRINGKVPEDEHQSQTATGSKVPPPPPPPKQNKSITPPPPIGSKKSRIAGANRYA